MKTLPRFTVTPLLLAACLIGIPAVLYAHGGDPNLIHACKKNSNGNLRVIAPDGTCKRNETALDWSITGPAGPTGPQGPQGPMGPQGPAGPEFPITCPPDSMLLGTTCVDKYEASVWSISDPTKVAALKALAQGGAAKLADLTALGATLRGATTDDYPCLDNGNDCKDKIFAFSIPGVMPSAFITWFQAQQAAANSGKRLLTSAEWQMAAAGTPDPGAFPGSADCNTDTAPASPAGARANCVSGWGVFDMVGNLAEWVDQWVPLSTTSEPPPLYAEDEVGLAGAETVAGPGALIRGGSYGNSQNAGVFAVNARHLPTVQSGGIGFRCGR